jgi:hypothetical protein
VKALTKAQAREVEASIDDEIEMRDRFYAVAEGHYAHDMREYARRRGDEINRRICQRQMLYWAELMESGLTPEDLNQ